MGLRTLFVLVAIALVIWAVKRVWGNRRSSPPGHRRSPQKVLRCGHCGLHVPAGEAVQDRTGVYCCPEHRRAAERGSGADS